MLVGTRQRDSEEFDYAVAYISAGHVDLVQELESEGVPVLSLGGAGTWDPRWLWRLRKVLSEVDVVHAHSPVPAVGARLARLTLSRRKRPGLITTEHNVWASHHRLTRLAERATFYLDDEHLAVSEAVRASLPSTLQGEVEVLLQGVDLARVRAAADREGVRRELGIGVGELVVGTVANLRPQKGYVDLLVAAAEVVRRVPNARFVAVGQGDQLDELTQLQLELGLTERFSFVGYREDAVRVMSGFDVFCLASHHEGLPVALMEALGLGIPVVVTRAGGMGELVEDGVEGALVEPRRPEILAEALVASLLDETVRKEQAERAAERGDGLSIQRSVIAHEELYARLGRHRV